MCKVPALNDAEHGYVYQISVEDIACLICAKQVFSTDDRGTWSFFARSCNRNLSSIFLHYMKMSREATRQMFRFTLGYE